MSDYNGTPSEVNILQQDTIWIWLTRDATMI